VKLTKSQLLRKGLGDELILYQQQEKAKLALLAHTRDLIIQEAGKPCLEQRRSVNGRYGRGHCQGRSNTR
jgi:hypothetical protein